MDLFSTINPLGTLTTPDDLNSTVKADEVDKNDDGIAEAARMVQVVSRPILTAVGSIGNLMAFFVMTRGSLNRVSTCFYMSILALADTGVLWTGAFLAWVGYLTHWEVDPDVWTDCKPGYFIFFFFRHYSSALLCIMSVEKFFALYFPLKTKSICTVRTARWVSGITAFIFVAFNFQFFFVFDALTDSDGIKYCGFVRVHENYEGIFYQVDSTLYSFAPLTIMILANSAIIYKFMKAKCESRQGGTESTSQALSKSAMKGTAMLITVSVTFVILTGPVSLLYVFTYNPNPLTKALLTVPQYVNHSINGILYCIVGSRFRNELMTLLSCRKASNIKSRSVKDVSDFAGSAEVTSSVNSHM